MRSVTATGSSKAKPKELQHIVQETFQSARKCHEILECIDERLKSKRSPYSCVAKVSFFLSKFIFYLPKTLELLEDLLRLGSEVFLTQAVDLKTTLIEVCNNNVNTPGKGLSAGKSSDTSLVKSKAAHLIKLLSERDRLFELRQETAAGECSIDIGYAQNSEINRSTESFPIYYK